MLSNFYSPKPYTITWMALWMANFMCRVISKSFNKRGLLKTRVLLSLKSTPSTEILVIRAPSWNNEKVKFICSYFSHIFKHHVFAVNLRIMKKGELRNPLAKTASKKITS